MIGAFKAFAKRHWPALRLRTILFSVLLLVAALPVAGAVFLRVYENTLVRQTEAELVAQGAALAAAAEVAWPSGEGAGGGAGRAPAAADYRPEPLAIDLSSTPVLPERPPAARVDSGSPADPAATAAAERLAPVLKATSRTTLASIVLLDGSGRVLVGAEAGGSYAGLPEVRAALGGEPRTVLRRNAAYHPRYSFEWLSRASALRIHHARPIVSPEGRVLGALLLSRSPRALFRGVYQDRAKIGLGLAGICAALVVLSGLVSRGITRPIEALGAATRRLAAGQGGAPETPPTAAVEIRALFDDVRVMAEAIERRSRYLRDFAAAVSHEFKTPLAGIRGATELLQDHEEMSPTERRRFLGNIAADTERLSQLVARLLDLARADMARPEGGASVEVAGPVRRAADAQAAGLQLELSLPPELPPVSVPAGAIETVLTALFENSRQAGATRVDIIARATGDAVVLSVADDGRGVVEADRDRLFEPFFTSRRDSGGTGLGLSIARSLLAASHGAITLEPSARGTRFEVSLPLASARPAGRLDPSSS